MQHMDLLGPEAVTPPPANADLSRLVHDMRRLLRAVTPPHLCMHFQLTERLPAVAADSMRVRQVLTHLVAALGCKAVGHQWSLTVRTRALAWLAGDPEVPALELLLGSDSGQALALLRWAVVTQGRSHAGNPLLAATVQQTLHELRCTVNFVRIPGEGTAAQLLFPAAEAGEATSA